MRSPYPVDASRKWRRALALPLLALLASACDGPTEPGTQLANLQFSVLAPSTVRSLIVSVSGPGLDSTIVTNFSVTELATAQGTVSVIAGATRAISIVAVDTGGVQTHRADTTVRLLPGANPPLALVLRPISGSVGITVTFGNVSILLSATDTAVQASDSTQFTAAVTTPWGNPPVDSLVWGSDSPGVATVSSGRVRGLNPGIATISVAYGGAVARRRIRVLPGSPATSPIYFKFVPTGGSFASEEIYSVLPTGSTPVPVVARAGMDRFPSLDRTRTRLAISSEAWCTPGCAGQVVFRLFIGNSDGAAMTLVPTLNGATISAKAFSPTGTHLVVEAAPGSTNPRDRRLFLINSDGTGGSQISSEESQYPDWSPDGSRIIFCSPSGVTAVSPSGNNRVVLRALSIAPNPEPSCFSARYNPAGTRIAFDDPSGDIWVMNADGSSLTQVTNSGAAQDSGPVWSPDGQHIAFSSNRSGSLQVWVMKNDGTSLRQLTNVTGGANDLAW